MQAQPAPNGAPQCPVSNLFGLCPASTNGSRPTTSSSRGCGFFGFNYAGENSPMNGISDGPHNLQSIEQREQKALVDLMFSAKKDSELRKLKNADRLCPEPDDVLAAALGAPARAVLMRAERVGAQTGYRDGHLTSRWGFCPPSVNESPMALSMSPGRVWSDLCDRLMGLVSMGQVRTAIMDVPLVPGTEDVIPDQALWAAAACLGILISAYRYEERNSDGPPISTSVPMEEQPEELKLIPLNVATPYRAICSRLGRPLPHMTQADLSITNCKLRDPFSVYPYPHRVENMDLLWPVFGDRAEATFLLCMVEVHGLFAPAVEIITRCQEFVMAKDREELLRELVKLKQIVDQLGYVFHKISVNPSSGQMFANPVDWGQKFAKFSAPLSKRVPALSGLALPVFHLMDAFLGRRNYDTFLGKEALHLRTWLPLNIRAFVTAVEKYYSVPEFIAATGDPRLIGILEGIVEAYAGERGFMGTHRYKVYGFLELVTKTGRSETNGGSGAADSEGRPWLEVHKMLSDAMLERLAPFRKNDLTLKPQEMRGSFEECRFSARVAGRAHIDDDRQRRTALVSLDVGDKGITFAPGDRLAIMPLNKWQEVAKVADTLGIMDRLDEYISPEENTEWSRYARHESDVRRFEHRPGQLKIGDILRKGHLAPLSRETVLKVHTLLRGASSKIFQALSSDEWPLSGSLGDLLILASSEIPKGSPQWMTAFKQDGLSWLLNLVPVEVPRTYSISSYCRWDKIPSAIELTVTRAEHKVNPLFVPPDRDFRREGVSSGFLNPYPGGEDDMIVDESEEVLVGISRPLNFQLPINHAAPIAMFAGGSGIAPFRGFLQSRFDASTVGGGRNIVFLGVQSRDKFLYEHELRHYVKSNGLELHVAFSRDKRGLVYDRSDLVEREMQPRHIDVTIGEQGKIVTDLVVPAKQGGLGGYLYVCGSLGFFETVMAGIKKAISKNRIISLGSAEAILATAFAERRFMLDIFMTPRTMSLKAPVISISTLAKNTGHQPKETPMWIAVHGAVYDITDFLSIHPGGSLIVAASAGLDATKKFEDVAHSSNPEVMSLLSKYFIGNLAPLHNFEHTPEFQSLYEDWLDYLKRSVEGLTTLSLEVRDFTEESKWIAAGGMLNTAMLRKFHQFQTRVLRSGFPGLFGQKLQELYLKLSFALVSSHNSTSSVLPDVIGIVARAQTSAGAAVALKELTEAGNLVCDPTTAQAFAHGIIRFAQTAARFDVRFLEQVREEICEGIDAFDTIARTFRKETAALKVAIGRTQIQRVAALLVSLLEKIANRLETFFAELSTLSIYHPEIEGNPARARWKLVQRRITDGSFFLYAAELSVDNTGFTEVNSEGSESLLIHRRSVRVRRGSAKGITLDKVVARISNNVNSYLEQDMQAASQGTSEVLMPTPRVPRSLAELHSYRAEEAPISSYETHLERTASVRTQNFLAQQGRVLQNRRQDSSRQAGKARPQSPVGAEPSLPPVRERGHTPPYNAGNVLEQWPKRPATASSQQQHTMPVASLPSGLDTPRQMGPGNGSLSSTPYMMPQRHQKSPHSTPPLGTEYFGSPSPPHAGTQDAFSQSPPSRYPDTLSPNPHGGRIERPRSSSATHAAPSWDMADANRSNRDSPPPLRGPGVDNGRIPPRRFVSYGNPQERQGGPGSFATADQSPPVRPYSRQDSFPGRILPGNSSRGPTPPPTPPVTSSAYSYREAGGEPPRHPGSLHLRSASADRDGRMAPSGSSGKSMMGFMRRNLQKFASGNGT